MFEKRNGFFSRTGTGFRYPVNDATAAAVCELEWARKILAADPVVFQNGKSSHAVANACVDRCENVLLQFLHVTAGAEAI